MLDGPISVDVSEQWETHVLPAGSDDAQARHMAVSSVMPKQAQELADEETGITRRICFASISFRANWLRLACRFRASY